jgi:hypothetical protein
VSCISVVFGVVHYYTPITEMRVGQRECTFIMARGLIGGDMVLCCKMEGV